MMRLSVRRLTGKSVCFGGDARERMLNGIERIAKAVSVTLGPKGRNVIIRQESGDPKITKDGVTVARSIEFTDQFEDVGARLIRQVAAKTNDVAGDGTTTATILAWSIFAEGYKCVATGANPMDLKRGIDIAVAELVKGLEEQRRDVKDFAMLVNVATISANGERKLGELIATAVESVGADGFIAVLDGTAKATSWVRHEGWSVEAGVLHNALVSDTEALCTRLEAPLVFVAGSAVESAEEMFLLLEAAATAQRPLVVLAPAVGPEALDVAVRNHSAGAVKVIVASVGPDNADLLEDAAASCGCPVGSLASLRAGITPTFGTAQSAQQTMDSTVVCGAADVTARVRLLQERIDRTLAEGPRDRLRERIAKLVRRFAVIRVGGRTAVEVSESKDRVIDALNAARNAISDGIVAGGGAALLHATRRLDALLRADDEMEQDRRMGILIVRNAARLPMRIIGDNAGVEGAVVIGNVEEFEDCAKGYDAQNDAYIDMFEAGIVDPVKVVRSCINDAASVAGLMITTEASVCDDTFRH